MRHLYQTDFSGYTRDDGCLLFTIFRASGELAGKALSRPRAITLMDSLHSYVKASYGSGNTPAISDEDNQSEPGVFVWDHTVVFNETLKLLGSRKRVVYTGRIYMPWEEAKGHTSFGDRDGDIIIHQIKTINGNGHFRQLDYDPWEPGTTMADLKSLRFYKVLG